MITQRKLLYILQISLCLMFVQSTPVQAVTGRATLVQIQNLTGLEIESVTVVHKYSNNYKDRESWRNIPSGRIAPRKMRVRYHTGALTTGQDWWFITWKYKNNNSIQYTSPNNFRAFFDALEGVSLRAMNIGGQMSPGASVTEKLGKTLMNNESTSGFKSYILRSEDQARGLVITITRNSVKFDSASGHASIDEIRTKLLPRRQVTERKKRVERTYTQPQAPQRVAIRRQTCQSMIQNKIAWDHRGNKKWNPSNIKKLCGGSTNIQPALCFQKVLHGRLPLTRGRQWSYPNAIKLCSQTTNAGKIIQCFNRQRQSTNQQQVINKCAFKNRRVARPPVARRAVRAPTAVPARPPVARRAVRTPTAVPARPPQARRVPRL